MLPHTACFQTLFKIESEITVFLFLHNSYYLGFCAARSPTLILSKCSESWGSHHYNVDNNSYLHYM